MQAQLTESLHMSLNSISNPLSVSGGQANNVPPRRDHLEKEMTAHSSILAWKLPGTEEPGRLQSMGLQGSDTT